MALKSTVIIMDWSNLVYESYSFKMLKILVFKSFWSKASNKYVKNFKKKNNSLEMYTYHLGQSVYTS